MHQQDPEQWTAKKIAYEYKVDQGLTGKILSDYKERFLSSAICLVSASQLS